MLSVAACLVLCCALSLKTLTNDAVTDSPEFDSYMNCISVSVNKPVTYPDDRPQYCPTPTPPILDIERPPQVDADPLPTTPPILFSTPENAINFLIESLSNGYKFDSENGNSYSDRFVENCYEITVWKNDGTYISYKFYSNSGSLFVNNSFVKISSIQKNRLCELLQAGV